MVLDLANGASLPVVLALFHTCFNITNTALLIAFIPQIERICRFLIKDDAQEQQEEFNLQYIEGSLMKTPEIAVLQAQKETIRFAQRIQQMFSMVIQLANEKNDKQQDKLISQIANEEDISDKTELAIAHYLEQVSNAHLSDDTKEKIRRMMREIGELESIGDACYNLARILKRKQESGQAFTQGQQEDIRQLMALVDKALTQMNLAMSGHHSMQPAHETYHIENDINSLRNRLKDESMKEVNDHAYTYTIGTIYNDFINECEKLGDYVVNVVEARLGIS